MDGLKEFCEIAKKNEKGQSCLIRRMMNYYYKIMNYYELLQYICGKEKY